MCVNIQYNMNVLQCTHFRDLLFFLGMVTVFTSVAPQAESVWLDELDLSEFTVEQVQRRGPFRGPIHPQICRSFMGNSIRINGQEFERGVGTCATSIFLFHLHGDAERFTAQAGVDDEVEGSRASVEFLVYADDEIVWQSGTMKPREDAKEIEVNLTGVDELALVVTDAGDGDRRDHANWADAGFEVDGKKPTPFSIEPSAPYILTPKPPRTPRINGPKVFGVRPGSPFRFTIPATGERPMTFEGENLPHGLQLDSDTGRITGRITERGTYLVTLHAANRLGKTEKQFRIVVGDRICLTPPIGWNSWNCWGREVDANKIRTAATAMKESGLIDHGWSYVNIDDGWQGTRGGPFNALQGNEKFTDMDELCDDVHNLGLRIGIYSTPWMTSYAGFPGGSSDREDGAWEYGDEVHDQPGTNLGRVRGGRRHGKHSFAENDVRQWVEWGVDYLKYDWRPNDIPHVEEMSEALKKCGRDIVYSLSNNAPFEHVGVWARLANTWRTSGDIRDTWQSVDNIGFSQSKWAEYAGPGHWNDPDMLVVGYVGWGRDLHSSRLTPEEQYSHVSLWCLLSAPLLLGCDLTRLDEFTLSLLTNDEVLAVNQYPLGDQARCVFKEQKKEIWAKRMEDDSIAAGLFNRDFEFLDPVEIALQWSHVGIQGEYRVRDLWRQKNLGVFEDRFVAEVPPHGCILVRLIPR